MSAALAAGWRAHAALCASDSTARVVASLSESIYARAGDVLVWLGGPQAMLHPRAVRVQVPPRAEVDDVLAVALEGASRWEPAPLALDAGAPTTVARGCRELAGSLDVLGAPAGLTALLLGGPSPTTEAALLVPALPAARALGDACARDDWRGAADAAAHLVGLGPGLTPSGDDFVGGAFFARVALGPGGDGWTTAAARVAELAATRTHPISAALLGDLLRGEGWQPLHDLVRALARADAAAARDAASRLVGLGHTSGWDLLAGFLAGARAPLLTRRAVLRGLGVAAAALAGRATQARASVVDLAALIEPIRAAVAPPWPTAEATVSGRR